MSDIDIIKSLIMDEGIHLGKSVTKTLEARLLFSGWHIVLTSNLVRCLKEEMTSPDFEESVDFKDEKDVQDVINILVYRYFKGWSKFIVIFDKDYDFLRVNMMFRGLDYLTHFIGVFCDNREIDYLTRMFYGCINISEVVFIGNPFKVERMDSVFERCEHLIYVDMKDLKTICTRSLDDLFYGCRKLQVVDMSGVSVASDVSVGMFLDCKELKTLKVNSSLNGALHKVLPLQVYQHDYLNYKEVFNGRCEIIVTR